MQIWHKAIGIMWACSLGSMGLAQEFSFVKIDPKGTYLRDSQEAAPPSVISLWQGGIQAIPIGHENEYFLEVRTVGWFDRALDNPLSHNVSNQAVAVFSGEGTVDPDWSRQHRVFEARDAGEDFATLPTWVGNLPTDISEDFGVAHELVRIRIPQGAGFVYFTPFDNGFWNNGDDFSMPGADLRGFGAEWRVVPATVPEPASLGALLLGLSLAAARRGHRRSRSVL